MRLIDADELVRRFSDSKSGKTLKTMVDTQPTVMSDREKENQKVKDCFNALILRMKEHDEDCSYPPNAVDEGYSLAVSHMKMEINNILKELELRVQIM